LNLHKTKFPPPRGPRAPRVGAGRPPAFRRSAMLRPNSTHRLLDYVLAKLDEEPLRRRALLCEDLAELVPDEALARQLREQARSLHHTDRRTRLLRLAFFRCPPATDGS
jgi:hypothetical protein